MTPVERLRALLRAPGCAVAPGAFDCWSARLIAQAGFDLCYLTGFGASAAHLGAPDIGLMTGSEMADIAARVAAAVEIPVIADADTGYGNALNVRHTVAAYRRAGVAAIQIEDQGFPKRCGHLEGKRVIETDAMAAKIRAAKAAAGEALLVVARTDSRAVNGLDDALARGRAYRDAGADILFIESPQTLDEMKAVAREFPGTALLANMVEGGKTPYLDAAELGRLGFALAIFPITTLLAATGAVQATLAQLRRDGKADQRAIPSFGDMHRVSGLDDYLADARTAERTT